MTTRTMVVSTWVFAVSCTNGPAMPEAIAVAQQNDLGVTTLRTSRSTESGNDVFALRGYSSDDNELASVQLTIGTIPDLPQFLPGDTLGSELVISVAGLDDSRMVTHETQLFRIRPPAAEPAVLEFLAIPEVSSVLEHEANVVVPGKQSPAPAEAPYYIGGTSQCPASFLLTTPIAAQCCFSTAMASGLWGNTMFVNPSNQFVQRDYNPFNQDGSGGYGNPNSGGGTCKASDGISACSGSGCYWGPYGFARPSTWATGGAKVVVYNDMMQNGYNYCDSGSGTARYGSVTGNLATGQGCPGGTSGGNGQWDY